MPAETLRSDADGSGLVGIADLINMFEGAEEASIDARAECERDRDYVDNKQLTADQKAELTKRGQPPLIINRIKRKVDFLKGFEQQQRIDPRALPRTPKHEQDADAVEQALRYVAEQQDFDQKRSRVWDNLLVEGMGGYDVSVAPGYDGEMEIQIRRVPWNRIFIDPHSSEPDFSDAKYLGLVRWGDRDDLLLEYPDGADVLDATLNDNSRSDTYDDRPTYKVWADRFRKRVRICQIWIKRGEEWHFAEFTKGGILKAGPSPYRTDKGESDCPLIFGSAYVDRDNNRYGLVREMIGVQDEINKRRSKMLHIMNVKQITMEEGAVDDIERFRKESARPDGVKVINPGYIDKIRDDAQLDLATAHAQLLQEAKGEIDMMAGNIALQGNALQKSAASGKAIIASQQGGAMEIAPLMDALRHLDIRVFRAAWFRARQFWTKEKAIRIFDDERNIKWFLMNVSPEQQQQMQMQMQQNPEMQEQIAGMVGSLAELDCDIIIDDAPDGLTPQLEQFQSLVELKKMDANGELPFRAIVTAMPNLKNKEQVLAAMDEGPPPEVQELNQRMQMLEMAMAEAKVQETQASAALKGAQAQAALMPEQQQPGAPVDPGPTEAEQMETLASAEDKRASAFLKYQQADKVRVDTMLAPQAMQQKFAADKAKARQMQDSRRRA
jgi:hypothetical protein